MEKKVFKPVSVNFSEEEYKSILDRANSIGLNVASYIRLVMKTSGITVTATTKNNE